MPPRTTVEMKPAFCSARARRRWRFVEVIDVKPSLALEAFWRWEQVLARSTRDIVAWRNVDECLYTECNYRLIESNLVSALSPG